MTTTIDDLIHEIDVRLGDKALIPLSSLVKLGLARSPTALLAMIKRGDLPAIRLGGRYLIPKNSVLELVRQNLCKN